MSGPPSADGAEGAEGEEGEEGEDRKFPSMAAPHRTSAPPHKRSPRTPSRAKLAFPEPVELRKELRKELQERAVEPLIV